MRFDTQARTEHHRWYNRRILPKDSACISYQASDGGQRAILGSHDRRHWSLRR